MGPGQPTERRLRQVALNLRTPAAIVVVLLVLAISLVGASTPPLIPVGGGPTPGAATPVPGQVGALRTIPILAPGGAVRTAFPGGAGLGDQTLVRAQAQRLAERIGIGVVMPRLWSALDGTSGGVGVVGGLAPADPTYPYRYRSIEHVLDPALTASIVAAHRSDLVELAGLLMVAAADADPASGDGSAGEAAYVVLDRLRRDPTDCDAHLDFAALVALGQEPRARVVDRLFDQAAEACPGDPTPRWFEGLAQTAESVATSSDGVGLEAQGLNRTQALARPLATYRAWEREQPGSALPWAGEAAALATEAEQMARFRNMPFTARADAELALARYRTADSLEHDPSFVVGEAWATGLLGRHDDAADLIGKAVAEAPGVADYRVLEVQLLEAAGRYDDAAVLADDDHDRPVSPLSLIPQPAVDTPSYLSLGQTGATHTILRDATTSIGGGGGLVSSLGYIPDYRSDDALIVDDTPWCPVETRLRELVLSGRYADALAVQGHDPDDCASGRPNHRHVSADFDNAMPDRQLLHAIAADQLGEVATRDRYVLTQQTNPGLSPVLDSEQNLFRYAGDLPRAEAAVQRWVRDLPHDTLAQQRLGEVRFLRGDLEGAEKPFEIAAAAHVTCRSSAVDCTPWGAAERAAAELDLATVYDEEGRPGPAQTHYLHALHTSVTLPTTAAAGLRLGQLAVAEGDVPGAVKRLTTVQRLVHFHETHALPKQSDFDALQDSVSGGAESDDLAVAILAAADDGKPADAGLAVRSARLARLHDPLSPIYLDTAAQAEQLAGHPARAAREYRTALAADPTIYQSWNNLGVLVAAQGHHDEAVDAFQHAVAANPSYARGWFNLGVELGIGAGPRDLVAAERASAEAVRLDRSYRGQGPALLPDTSAIDTGVDVSRPVPPGWSFVARATPLTPSLTWVVLAIALLRLLFALGLDTVVGAVGGRLLRREWHVDRPWTRAWERVDRFPALVWAILVGAAIAAVPLVRGAQGQWAGTLAVVVVMPAVLWLYVAVSRAAAGELETPPHRAWVPGMAFGVVGAVAGYAFVPMPVNVDHDSSRRVRWAGCVSLAVISGAFLLVALLTGVPLARTVGQVVLAVLSTALFPVRPFDGGYGRSRRVEALSALALLAVGVALTLGLV